MANLIRRRPINDLVGLRDDFDRLFNDTFRIFDEGYGDRVAWKPAVDMEENQEEYVIKAELPGIKKEDIKISIVDNKVMIGGEIIEEKDVQEKNYFLKERARGKFSRGFTLPTSVNSNKADAIYKDGILTLKLPKAEEAKPKQISIKDE